VIDEFTRECLVPRADRGITSPDVIDSLAEFVANRGVPKHIRSDNGAEFIANELRAWLDRAGRLDALHLARQPLGERLRRELPQPKPVSRAA
jgi:transposase InsO family protein